MEAAHGEGLVRKLISLAALLFLLAPALVVRAEAPAWLRSENDHVTEGNEKLSAGDNKGALAAYDKAARELPSEGGVHLNRGLALLKAGELAPAREALRLATNSPASPAVRADAYHDLGIGFYREADAHAAKNEHEEAQKLFREASDAFKQSMRLRPGNRNTAWNYELAARRVREQKEKQEEKDKQEQKDDQKQDQEQQDPQDGDQQGDPQAQKDQSGKEQQNKPEDKPKDAKNDPKSQQQKDAEKKKQEAAQNAEQDPAKPKPENLRPDMAQALDALQDSEENLERLRALQRAQQERRVPEKDW